MAMSSEELLKSLVDSEILAPDYVQSLNEQLLSAAKPQNINELIKSIIRSGRLTPFQGAQIAAGRSKSLVLGDYTIVDKIGSGGMGQVFKAIHRRMKRTVAIKILAPAALKDQQAIRRFQQEVEAAAKLLHPNIVAAFDAGRANGQQYLVMEYVDGRDLAAIVKERGRVPLDDALDYIAQAARGLQYAHSMGVVHRDIKPANLLVDSRGTVKILDMGLARLDVAAMAEGLTQSGQMMGTVDYMPPEQAFDARRADARSDIYSLGCTLYRIVTGEAMYAGESLVQVSLAHRELPIPDLRAKCPEASPRLNEVFRRTVAKRPEDRYQTMADVVSALAALVTSRAETVRPIDATISFSPAAQSPSDNKNPGEIQVRKTPSLTKVVVAEKTKYLAAKVIGGVFATIVAPFFVAILLKYFDKPEAPTVPTKSELAAADVRPAPSEIHTSNPSQAVSEPAHSKQGPPATGGIGGANQAEPPGRANAPFDAAQARAFQQSWAQYASIPVERRNSIGMRLVLIPPGTFLMGSTPDQVVASQSLGERPKKGPDELGEAAVAEETPAHRVQINRPYLLSATEVTFAQFKSFVEATDYLTDAEHFNNSEAAPRKKKKAAIGRPDWRRPGYATGDDLPVTVITWRDAVQFCNWLSERENLKPCYTRDSKGSWVLLAAGEGYRPPTEAEWEFACRAGTTGLFSFGDKPEGLEEFGWYHKNASAASHSVGLKRPNHFGLYDMHGNVEEWCHDRFLVDYYKHSPRANPFGPDAGDAHVVRGGSWIDSDGSACRSASRLAHGARNNHRGFRVACVTLHPRAIPAKGRAGAE
jgi:eukaryotic-like serine/threonine-protein kinase